MMDLPERALLLTFLVGGDAYALDSLRVREIVKPKPVRPIPGAPTGLAGLVQLRDREVIPVVDLRARFKLASNADSTGRRIVVCVVEGRLIGVFVDAVVDVVNVKTADIRSSHSVFSNGVADYIAGVCQVGRRLLVLLNLKRLLSTDDMVAIDSVAELLAATDDGASQ